jgi:hypothetical protein
VKGGKGGKKGRLDQASGLGGEVQNIPIFNFKDYSNKKCENSVYFSCQLIILSC